MGTIGHTTPPAEWLGDSVRRSEITEIIRFLEDQGTFHFPTLRTGLFSAAAGDSEELHATGYQNVWTRDNVHIANAQWVLGHTDVAARCARTLMEFYSRHRKRFDAIIRGQADPSDPMQRPPIRFDGEQLTELSEKWAHAQNDALGYFLWLYCRLAREGAVPLDEVAWPVLGDLVSYFEAIRYWEDEDSGHWEETRKIEASSIGVVVAGLKALGDVVHFSAPWPAEQSACEAIREKLIVQGETALEEILPAECIQDDDEKRRRYDAALLFLIYPCDVVDGEMADRIVDDVLTHLEGPYGIRRYLGDSYWCADYKELMSAESRTADFSEDLARRDKLLRPGLEAQWCIFDPIISCIYGRKFQQSGSIEDRSRQIHHLKRSLSQLTPESSRFGPYRCPESYFCENGQYVPNDITPLLWTQANLRLALHMMSETADP